MQSLCFVVSLITSCVVHRVVVWSGRIYLSHLCYLCKFAVQIFVQTSHKEQILFVLFVHGTCARANMGVAFVHSSNQHDNHYQSLCASPPRTLKEIICICAPT